MHAPAAAPQPTATTAMTITITTADTTSVFCVLNGLVFKRLSELFQVMAV